MRRTLAVGLFVALILLALSPPVSAAVEDEGRGVDVETEEIGGYTWTKDIRVTRNTGEDTMPQVVVDASQNSHIIWQRQGY